MSGIEQKKTTKENIIEAAFSFFSGPRFTDVSLSEIAAKAGISKAAIFRHFESKDELFEEMQEYLFDTVAANIKKAQSEYLADTSLDDAERWRKVLAYAVQMVMAHIEFLWFFFSRFVSSTNYEALFFEEMRKRDLDLFGPDGNVRLSSGGHSLVIGDLEKFFQVEYIIFTFSFFVGFVAQKEPKKMKPGEAAAFADKLSLLLEKGINSDEDVVSAERMVQIDALCAIDKASLPPEDPVFKALSAVIRKHGFPGTTVEAIADELGLAKSSLYSYFKNKDDMILNLVQQELLQLAEMIARKTKLVHEGSETGYAVMRTEMEYFRSRPDLIPVIRWLKMKGSFIPRNEMCNKARMNVSFLSRLEMYSVNYPITAGTYYDWLSMLSASILALADLHGFSDEQSYSALKQCFRYVQKGVKQ